MSTSSFTPLAAWQRLRAGSEGGAATVRAIRPVPTAQPVAAVFRCADAGAASESIFGQTPGTLVEVSTWGHVMDFGVLGTLEYSVEKLDIPLVVVLGHQNCHAMHAAIRSWTEGALPDGAARPAVEHAVASMVRRGIGAESADALAAAHVVETGMALLERSPLIARRVDAGACGIICATVGAGGRIRTHATVGPVGESSEALLECV